MSLICIYVIIHTIYSAVHHSAHMSSIGLHADPQDGLFFESINCLVDGCGSPMRFELHRGKEIMKCRKRKCQKRTARWVSVYFHQKGTARIAIRCMCAVPDTHIQSAWVTQSFKHMFVLPHCLSIYYHWCVTHRPTGGATNRSSAGVDFDHAATVRLQLEIALCFAWGTTMYSHAWNNRRPLHRCTLH